MKRRERKDLERFNAKYRRGNNAAAVGETPAEEEAAPSQLKSFSLSYILGTPFLTAIAILSFYVTGIVTLKSGSAGEDWLIFGISAALSLILWSQLGLQRIRTLMHEFKHAMAVMLTGGRVDKIELLEDGGGNIQYSHYDEGRRHAAIIALAPYFFPLLSFPALLICLVSPEDERSYFLLALGFTLAADLATGTRDIGPHQTDIQHVFGKFYLAGFFIAAADLCWLGIASIWVAGGRRGYVELWNLITGWFAPYF